MEKDLNLRLETVSALLGQHIKIHNGYSRDTVFLQYFDSERQGTKNNILQISK